jgi:hypothetical protein
VFESGGDWYNVVWVTDYADSGSSNAQYSLHGSTGYVEYTYNGQKYQVFDEVGGNRRVHDDFHSVKIPKEHLNNNTYKVGSYLMLYDYTNPSKLSGRYYCAGNSIVSPEYLFENRNGDEAVNLIACPDIDFQGSGASLNNVANAVAGLGTSPAYILMNGNVNYISYDADALTNLIKAAATVSGGSHPVILSRGHAECRGFTAPNLLKYFPTATGEYYYSVQVGDYTLVNLDTAEDDPDGQVESGSSKYGDRIHLNNQRSEQLSWIRSLSSGNLIAVSAMPLSNFDSKFGLGYESALKNKGAVLAIGGHADGFTLNESVSGSKIYTVVPAGNGSGMDVASILVSDGYAYIRECKYSSGRATYPVQKAVSLSNGSTQNISASQPPLSGSVYTVSTPEHIKWIADNCNSSSGFSGYTFKLANDIDMKLAAVNPIGGNDTNTSDTSARSKAFAGTFDGNGFTIKNLNIRSSSNNVGFFGALKNATVKHLTVSGGMVVGAWFVGGLAGYCDGSTIEDCYVDLTVYSNGGTKAGGVVGFMTNGSTITRSANYGSVSATHNGGSAGGIVGQVYGTSGTNTISNCFNRGSVSALGSSGLAGGIVGYGGDARLTISNCYNAAAIASPHYQGAVIASYDSGGYLSISNSYFANDFNGASTAVRNGNSWSSRGGSGTITGYNRSVMQSQNFANKLGSSVFTYLSSYNDKYPIHWNVFQYGSGDHVYTFTQTKYQSTNLDELAAVVDSIT